MFITSSSAAFWTGSNRLRQHVTRIRARRFVAHRSECVSSSERDLGISVPPRRRYPLISAQAGVSELVLLFSNAHCWMAASIIRRLLMQVFFGAVSVLPEKFGMAIAVSNARQTNTIKKVSSGRNLPMWILTPPPLLCCLAKTHDKTVIHHSGKIHAKLLQSNPLKRRFNQL
jgi:hypothetical protein